MHFLDRQSVKSISRPSIPEGEAVSKETENKAVKNPYLAAAAIIAGMTIALAFLVEGRYAVAGSGSGMAYAYRLDRWTGNVVVCVPNPNSSETESAAGRAVSLNCEVARDIPPWETAPLVK
jgi:hypothetical protein